MIYKRYQSAGSQDTYGLFEHRYVDERVTLPDTAQILSTKFLNQNNAPDVTINVTVLDNNFTEGGVDIESFEIGDKIMLIDDNYNLSGGVWGEGKWGDGRWGEKHMAVYGKEAYITGYTYSYDKIQLQCSFSPTQVSKRIEDINRDLTATRYEKATDVIS